VAFDEVDHARQQQALVVAGQRGLAGGDAQGGEFLRIGQSLGQGDAPARDIEEIDQVPFWPSVMTSCTGGVAEPITWAPALIASIIDQDRTKG
jgi:hypothetical protein